MKRGGSKLPATLPRDTSAQSRQIFEGFAGFRAFCASLVLDNGNPLILEPFEASIMRPHFGGVVEEVAILPTGNGKSSLLAARGLHHMLTTKRPECIVAAAAADQAGYIFDQMAGFVESSDLPLDVRRGIRAIYFRGSGPNDKPLGRIRVISADARVNSGVIPSLVLVDELQAHPGGYLYNMLQQRLNKRHAQMLTISNAGWDENSFLGQLRKKAHEHESFVRKGTFNHARVGSMEFLEWCLGEGDDTKDARVVKKANPLKHITIADLRTRLESPGLIWPEWLRATCGIWTSVETPWLGEHGEELWDSLRVDVGDLTDGESVHVAVRVGAGAGIAIVAPRENGRVQVAAEVIPANEQGRIPLEHVEFRIRQLAKQYDVREVAFDPGQFRRSAEILQEAGIPMIEVPQRPPRLAQATATLWRLISAGLLGHDGDPDLRAQVLAGHTQETEQGWRLVADAQTVGLVALAMAVHQATQIPADPPRFIAL